MPVRTRTKPKRPARRSRPAARPIKPAARILPPRSKVKPQDTWDLASLYGDDAAWETAFTAWEKDLGGYERFRGRLAESASILAECLQFDADFDRIGERLGTYACLRVSEDTAASDSQRMKGRYEHVATRAAEASSWIRPEIMEIDPAAMEKLLADEAIAPWRLALDRILRYRPHTLGRKEETLLAMQGQMAGAAAQVFRQLNDADLKWGFVRNERGQQVELSHSTYSALLHSAKRSVRKAAFDAYYTQYDQHRNTIAAAYAGSVQKDVYYARARHYGSALEAALFPDNVPLAVYTSLIESVRRGLPSLYRYYELRRRAMRLRDGIHHYDTYVPILADLQRRHTWDQAVRAVIEATAPLGGEYASALQRGLTGERWCDRYPNKGKRSGAFSSGSFDGMPYILMNYEPDVLDHVFTLAHEAGHSMHTWYSARSQPYQYYNYTIFVAEVASTFNEQLLARHMMARARTDRERAYLINRQLDEIRGTIFRQTMFAEFEKITHELVEAGEPLTVDLLRREYRKLLEAYFGPDFALDGCLDLECLRIPHFYSAFYVYKYATGLSAAIALSQRVIEGGQAELAAYLGFLRGGCSKFPLELLRDAGVDMQRPEPVDTAMRRFDELVTQLDELL